MVVVMRTEKKVSEETGYGRAGSPAVLHCNGRLSVVTQMRPRPREGRPTASKPPTSRVLEQTGQASRPEPRGTQQRLKILELRLIERVVLIRWFQSGQRLEETVPFTQARHRRLELEAQGAVVYWSERLVHHG